MAAVLVEGEWKRADGPSVMVNNMIAARWGVFHYALGYLGLGGQAPVRFHGVEPAAQRRGQLAG
jgi:hypothetical protein